VLDDATGCVVTANVAPSAPVGTVTLAGIETNPVSPESDTVAPPVGAGPLSNTVPIDALPPMTVAGFSDTDINPLEGVKKTSRK
jgi:hypothetical protein